MRGSRPKFDEKCKIPDFNDPAEDLLATSRGESLPGVWPLLPAAPSRKLNSLNASLPVPTALLVPAIPPHPRRGRALAWLFVATILWGLSFPLAKALVLAQQRRLPGADTWFLVALALVFRFGVAGVVVTLGSLGTLRRLTHNEVFQGLGLGLFATGGMLLQMDGLNYTAASTSAFLTSCYCVIIPGVVALQRRRPPPPAVAGCCALVLVGLGLLAGVDWRAFHLGRGEWETLGSSFFFAGQILWLERPRYAANRPAHATAVMFAVLAGLALPVMLARAAGPRQMLLAATGSPAIFLLLVALTLFCTLATFSLMNHWQKYLEATEAGLVYCAEPVWTSLISLWLPGWLALWTGTAYANEAATLKLLLGGGLITVANIGLQLYPRAVTPVR